jgi:hypothetical protein
MADLKPDLQRRVGHWVFESAASLSFDRLLAAAEPRWWLVSPEKGHFTLNGDPGPGKHPLLEFHVPGPDGKLSSWGWFLETAGRQ